MNNNLLRIGIAFVGAIIAVGAVLLGVGQYIKAKDKVNSLAQVMIDAGKISVSTLPDGTNLVGNAAQGYSFTTPAGWYVESSGNTVSVYPSYAPASSTNPQCKIELSVFENPQNDPLDTEMKNYLREDPTIDIEEISSESSVIDGYKEITWTGTIDGQETMLVYISAPEKIYELAPSSLSKNGDDASFCESYIPQMLSVFHID